MRAMLASLRSRLTGGAVLQSRSVTAYLGESAIAEPLRQLQADHPAIDIGSYPFNNEGRFGTTLVIRGTNAAQLDQLLEKITAMVGRAGGTPAA